LQSVKQRAQNASFEVRQYAKSNQKAHGIRLGELSEAQATLEPWNKIGVKTSKEIGETLNALTLGVYDKQYFLDKEQSLRATAAEAGVDPNSAELQKAITQIPRPTVADLLPYTNLDPKFHQTVLDVFAAYKKPIEKLKLARLNFIDMDFFDGKITAEEHKAKTSHINRIFSRAINNYVPQKRFGKHVVKVVADADVEIDGIQFKKGETVLRRHFARSAERDDYALKINDFHPNSTRILKLTEHFTPHPGTPELPAVLVEELKGDILSSVPEEKRGEFEKKFDDFQREHAVARAFDKHFITRKGSFGAETDFRKVYASYMESFSNMYSSVLMAREFNKLFSDSHKRIKQLESVSDERTPEGRAAAKERIEVENDLRFMQKHRELLYSGEGRVISAVKSFSFYWQFAADLTAAAVETAQVPTVVFPYLSERFGHVNSFSHLAKAAVDVGHWNTHGKGLDAQEVQLVERLMKEGTLDQGVVTDLVAQALSRYGDSDLTNTLKEWGGKALDLTVKPLRMTSKGSREAVAIAAYRLAKQKHPDLNFEELTNVSRHVVDSTMFDQSMANRAWITKNWQGVLTLFQGYTYNMANFGLQNKKAAMKYMALMLPLVGVGGMPMAEDMMDVVDAFGQTAKKLTGANGVTDTRLQLREMFDTEGLDPDLMMHGKMRTGMGIEEIYHLFANGPAPELDVSSRLSMGRMIPMGLPRLASTLASGTKNPDELLGDTLKNGLGYQGTVASNFLSYLGSDSRGAWKELEKIMPRAVRNLSTGLRYAIENKEVDYQNIELVPFDPENPADLVHIAGTLLGMRPTKLSQRIEADMTKRRQYDIWETQRAALMVKFKKYYMEENKEQADKTLEDIRKFNSEAPPGFQISKISEALKADMRRKKMVEMGMIRGDSKSASFRDFDRLFYREDDDEKIPESQVKTTF